MKKLFLTFLLYLIVYPVSSLDYGQIILGSDRSDDQFFLEIFFSQDLTDQICIVKYLGKRADTYVESYIFEIMNHMVSNNKARYEYILRLLLYSVFHPDYEQNELAARILINRNGIKYLIKQMHVFHDPLLKCQLMWLIPYIHDISCFGFCMTEGDSLLSILEQENGLPDIMVNEEIICLLNTIQQIGNRDYLFLCQSFIELSRDKEVVDTSRNTIRTLILREKE